MVAAIDPGWITAWLMRVNSSKENRRSCCTKGATISFRRKAGRHRVRNPKMRTHVVEFERFGKRGTRISPPIPRASAVHLSCRRCTPCCVCPPALASSPKAEEDNPDPSKLAPVAVIGWEELKERLVSQQNERKKMAEYVAVGATGTTL